MNKTYDENGELVEAGKGNIGVVTLNLPLIFQNAKEKGLTFISEVNKYVDICVGIHRKTYDYIGKQPAGSNPLLFMQGGMIGGHLKENEKIDSVIRKTFTASIGLTALNELTHLACGHSLRDGAEFAHTVVDTIQERIDFWKKKDGLLYGMYGTPAESLAGKQATQFRERFGVIPNVSDREYFTNSFHLHVDEEISQIEKQLGEVDLFMKIDGGRIQYVRFDNSHNNEAIKAVILHGIKLGLYFGVNYNQCICEKCGHHGTDFDGACPECGNERYTLFVRICGYLGYAQRNGDWTLNDTKLAEVRDRKSM